MHFIAESAINSLAINTVNVIFALVYALFAQKRPLVCQPAHCAVVWFTLAWGVHEVQWTMLSAQPVERRW